MIITRTKSFFVSQLLATVLGGSTAQAGVIVGLLTSPSTTAGVAVSNRSGAGTWQLYAIEDAGTTDFGISSYNITLSGATAINHRSPNGFATDGNGDAQTWGFTGLRRATNANPIVASQALPGTSPFLITGFGQTASTASAKILAIDPGATGISAASGASWGNYATVPSSTILSSYEVSTGHKWLFIAEGLGNIYAANITAAAFTVYNNASGTSVSTPVSGIISYPPIASSTVINNVNAIDPGSVMYTFSATPTSSESITWGGFSFISGPSPAVPATFDPATQKFNWNTIGSSIGSYKWSVQASTPTYGWTAGFVTVNITVPEPVTFSLFILTTVGIVCSVRHRPA